MSATEIKSQKLHFEASLRRCIAQAFNPAPLKQAERDVLKEIWTEITEEADCTGCHYAKTAIGDPQRVMVHKDGGIDEYLKGLTRRDIFTKTIVETCLVPSEVKTKLIEQLTWGKTSWTDDNEQTFNFFKVPPNTPQEALEEIARHYLSGGFGEPVSEAPLESMVKWMRMGGRFSLNHHVGMILDELSLLAFNSGNWSRVQQVKVEARYLQESP